MSRSARVKSLFKAALEIEDEERTAFLRRSEDDTGIRREVEEMLALDRRSDVRVDRPATHDVDLASPATTLFVGRHVGGYELRRCLAVGGMGAVYEGLQRSPERIVAVKVLRADLATDELRQRFRIESGFLARLQHPGIAHVYEADVAQVDGLPVPYMAMELVLDARSITDFARERALSVRERLELFIHVCAAVHHGHQRGVIHRDLKPGNILIGPDGSPKLIDFGVARAVDPEGVTHRTAAGVLIGTVQYMSPEQCADPRDIDVRSDVYSLGVVLYELLCGALPYDLTGVPLPEAARIIQEREPRRPSDVERTVGGDLETIVVGALAKDRDHRYQSVAELGDDVERYLAGEPIAARPLSALYRLRLFARRHRALAYSLLAVLLVSLSATVVSTRFAWGERAAREEQEYASYLANLSAADASLRVFDAVGARRRLDAVPPKLRGWEWAHLDLRSRPAAAEIAGPLPRCKGVRWAGERVYSIWESTEPEYCAAVHDARTGAELFRTGPHPGGSAGIAVLPDGRAVWMTHGAEPQRVYAWEPGAEEPVGFPSGHDAAAKGIRVTRDGLVVTASLDGTVRMRSADDLSTTRAAGSGEVPWYSLDVSPDGERVAVGGQDGTVHVLSTGSAKDVVLDGHVREVSAVAFSGDGELLASGAQDGTILMRDLSDGRVLDRLHGHASEVRALRFLDGQLLSSSNDGTVRAWDVASGAPLNVLYGHGGWVTGLDRSPEGEQVVSGAFDGTLRIWDPRATPGLHTLRGHLEIVRDVAFSPDGRWLGAASRDGTARIYDARTLAEHGTLDGHAGRVWCLAFDPSGRLVATGSDDPVIRIWNTTTGELEEELRDHDRGVFDLAFSPTGALFASSSWDQSVRVRDGETFEEVAVLEHGAALRHIDFHPTLERLATVDHQDALRLWNARTGELLWRRETGTWLHAVRFSPDGARLVTGEGDFDGRGVGVRTWDADSGEALALLEGHTEVVYDVAFSPDGTRLVSASADGSVRIWDPARGAELLALTDHESWVWCIAFSPDGRRIASGAGNYGGVGASLRVWESR